MNHESISAKYFIGSKSRKFSPAKLSPSMVFESQWSYKEIMSINTSLCKFLNMDGFHRDSHNYYSEISKLFMVRRKGHACSLVTTSHT